MLEQIAADLVPEEQAPPMLTREELFDESTFSYILSISDLYTRTKLLNQCRERAKELKCRRAFDENFAAYKKSVNDVGKIGMGTGISHFPSGKPPVKTGNWTANCDGVFRIRSLPGGEEIEEYASPIPIMPTAVYTNADTGVEKVELSYYTKQGWKSSIFDHSVIASAAKIVSTADQGTEATSENAKLLVKYLSDCLKENRETLPYSTSVSHVGWYGDKFIPYSGDIAFDGDREYKTIFDAIKAKGDFKSWQSYVGELRKNIYVRMLMGAAFASPLLSKIGALPFVLHLWGGTEAGKAQPLDTKIITPDGYKLMGDICVGDMVIGGDGKPHRVSGVFPQGVKDVYELTFADGRKTRCCKEHLWNVTTRTRRNHGRGYITMELQKMLSRSPVKTDKGYEYHVPLCLPVEYDTDVKLPIDPYLLGALIGDGCLKMTVNKANGSHNLYFNNSEDDVIGRVCILLSQNGSWLAKNESTSNQFVIRGCEWLKAAIRNLSLDKGSLDKFIPEMYLTASVYDRKRLLYGLMDTDGHVDSKGKCSYSTNSKQLAADVQRLAHGLGYKATTNTYERSDKKNTEYVVCISSDEDIFLSDKHIQHKKYSLDVRNRSEDKKSMAIIDVRPCGTAECQCIMVDSDEHTYLCDDFIVTHNTVGLMVAMSIWGDPAMGKMVRTMNMTTNSIMATASMLRDLPFAADELQVIKDRIGNYDKLIMSVCEGVDRGRMSFDKVNEMKSWNCAFLFSGEEPVTRSSSGGGAKNRVIEIECKSKVIENGKDTANFVRQNYGHAGQLYISYVRGIEHDLSSIYNRILTSLENIDCTDKQRLSMAAIMLGDTIGSVALFPNEKPLTAADVAPFLKTKAEVDTAERAYDYIKDVIAINDSRFCPNSYGDMSGEIWGRIEVECFKDAPEKRTVYINKTALVKLLRSEGYEFDAIKAKWADKGYLVRNSQGKMIHQTKCHNIKGAYVVLKL